MRNPIAPPVSVLAVCTFLLLVAALGLHAIPFYGVETDLLGDLVPTARALRAGKVVAENFEFKGPGYPLLLAIAGLGWGDWFGARLLNVASAAAGAWFAFLIAQRFLGVQAGLFVLVGLFLNSTWLRASIEAGTDMPAFALSLASTWLVLSERRSATWLLAGLLGGYAFLTRYNAAFLPVAAAVTWTLARATAKPRSEHDGLPGSRLALYALGFALPLAGWAIVGRAAAGTMLHNRNYLNIAFEIYGQGMMWDMFWTDAATRFHSLFDVLSFDPGRAFSALARNAALHWTRDLRELVPIWLGIPAVAGMLLAWPRRPGAGAIAAHFLLAYLVLTTVFYSPRFFLYLIPFYLLGAAALLFHPPSLLRGLAGRPAKTVPPPHRGRKPSRAAKNKPAIERSPSATARAAGWKSRAAWGLAVTMLVASGWLALRDTIGLFRDAPNEVRAAGAALHERGPAGARVMARKPHVAFFAEMDYVPMPQVGSLFELIQAGVETRADYLFFSGLEISLRPQFLLLADSAIALPGLTQIAWDRKPDHLYALYRFTREPMDKVRFHRRLVESSIDFAMRSPGNPKVQLYTGTLLADLGDARHALPYLERAAELDPKDPTTVSRIAWAHFELGDYPRAANECRRAIAMAWVSSGVHELMGTSLALMGMWPEATAALERAIRLEPTNPGYHLMLGIAQLAQGNADAGRRALDGCVGLDPGMAPVRDQVLSALSGSGVEDAPALMLRAHHLVMGRGDLTQLMNPSSNT